MNPLERLEVSVKMYDMLRKENQSARFWDGAGFRNANKTRIYTKEFITDVVTLERNKFVQKYGLRTDRNYTGMFLQMFRINHDFMDVLHSINPDYECDKWSDYGEGFTYAPRDAVWFRGYLLPPDCIQRFKQVLARRAACGVPTKEFYTDGND